MREYQILLDMIRRYFASTVWTHKIQEKQADIYANRFRLLQLINIVAAALTSCGILLIIFDDCVAYDVSTALLSFTTTGVTAYLKCYDLREMQKKHKDAANRFLIIRDELMELIAVTHMQEKSTADIYEEISAIKKELNELYLSAPSTSNSACKLAVKALKQNKEYTYTEEEIDSFLQPHLRGKIREENK